MFALPARRHAIVAIVTALVSLWYLSSLSWDLQLSPNTWPKDLSFRFPEISSSSKPASLPYTASIVYLLTTMPQSRPRDSIFCSLLLVQKNIPWRYQWPILLFHAGIYDSADNQSEFFDNIRNAIEDNAATTEDFDKLIKRIEFITMSIFFPTCLLRQ
ncbi:hypothetical protein R3P38DRAFT_3285953 [Favolaschia claudopus]|uniref:Uncharacterized protein n=1 Tax=Favolaschia claudopus TaxID=2862362 RepID=A0AAW0A1X4_9AGAR